MEFSVLLFVAIVQGISSAVRGLQIGVDIDRIPIRKVCAYPALLLLINTAIVIVEPYLFGTKGYLFARPAWIAYIVGMLLYMCIMSYTGAIFGGLVRQFLHLDYYEGD